MQTATWKAAPLMALGLALVLGAAAPAGAMTREEHSAAKARIEADYKTDKQRCDGLAGHAKDVCVSEAKGKEKVAKAELEAQYKPTAQHRANVAQAKADARYDTAKQKCDALAGNAKAACIQDAKAAQAAAKAEAKRS